MTIAPRSRIVRAVAAAVMCVCAEAVMQACPICFQVEDSHVASGIRAGVAVLLGVTGVVLAGFAVFVKGFVRRAVEPAEPRHPGTLEPRNP